MRRAPWVLFALALITRFWGISRPAKPIFDEVPYEEYVSHYYTGVEYFNLHPPAGKLILALGAKALGIPHETLATGGPDVSLRMLPALAGALVIPVFYLLLLQLGAARRVAALGAFLLIVDNGLVSVSRLILLDSLLLLFILGAISTYLAALSRTGGRRAALMVASAVVAGLAVSTKWSGLSALGIIGAHMTWRAWQARRVTGIQAREAGVVTAAAGAVYLATFVVHFALLPTPNPGTSPLDPERNASIARKIVTVHPAMRLANQSYATFQHIGASPWWSWPILKHPMFIWKGDPDSAGERGYILIEGNPVVWWAVLMTFAAMACALASPAARARIREHRAPLAFLGFAYLLNFAPFAFIGRTLFLYAYFPAFALSVGLAVIGAGALAGWNDGAGTNDWRFPSRWSATLYWGSAAVALASFLYLAPLSYGSPLTEPAVQQRLDALAR